MTACSSASTGDTSVAIDRGSVKENALFYIDGYDTDDLSDTTINIIIEKCINRFEDNETYECDITYCTLLECLKYLIRKSWVEEGSDSVGVLTKIREKEANVESEVNYAIASDTTSETGYKKLYDYFLKNPDEICSCLAPTYLGSFGLIAIGGTKQSQYNIVNSNPDSRNVYDTNYIGTKFTANKERRRRIAQQKSRDWRL
jgi:hypothetical protein